MTIENLRKTWDGLGRKDPLWAVLSQPAKTNNRWDRDEFFRTGKEEVESVFENLERRGLHVGRSRCLDFGCGVGRLSQPLCNYFEQVDGIDIAQSMIEQAQRLNQHGDRCHYHVNVREDLRLFADATFDFVYSNIVLQHMAPELAEGYVGEFLRVLAPGGIAVFQVPSRYVGADPLPDSGHRAELRLLGSSNGLRLQPRSQTTLTLEITNTSQVAWSADIPVVGNHWLDHDGRVLRFDDGRTAISSAVAPTERVAVQLSVTAPQEKGRYILEVDVVEEGVTWFASRGSTPLRIDVDVDEGRPGSLLYRRLDDAVRRGRELWLNRRGLSARFEMHALPRERVVSAVEAAGGQVLAVEDYDVSGPGWENYRYFVSRPATTGR